MAIVIFLVSSLTLGILAIIVSLLLTSRFMGGLELGPLSSVIWKCALLLISTEICLAFVPGFPFFLFPIAVWWLGYYFFLGLDPKEARVAALITIVMLIPVNICSNLLAEHLTPKENEPIELRQR
jgi:hypothetical protein